MNTIRFDIEFFSQYDARLRCLVKPPKASKNILGGFIRIYPRL